MKQTWSPRRGVFERARRIGEDPFMKPSCGSRTSRKDLPPLVGNSSGGLVDDFPRPFDDFPRLSTPHMPHLVWQLVLYGLKTGSPRVGNWVVWASLPSSSGAKTLPPFLLGISWLQGDLLPFLCISREEDSPFLRMSCGIFSRRSSSVMGSIFFNGALGGAIGKASFDFDETGEALMALGALRAQIGDGSSVVESEKSVGISAESEESAGISVESEDSVGVSPESDSSAFVHKAAS